MTDTAPSIGIRGWLSKEWDAVASLPGKIMDGIADLTVKGVTQNSGLSGQAASALKTHNDQINAILDGGNPDTVKTQAPAAPKR